MQNMASHSRWPSAAAVGALVFSAAAAVVLTNSVTLLVGRDAASVAAECASGEGERYVSCIRTQYTHAHTVQK